MLSCGFASTNRGDEVPLLRGVRALSIFAGNCSVCSLDRRSRRRFLLLRRDVRASRCQIKRRRRSAKSSHGVQAWCRVRSPRPQRCPFAHASVPCGGSQTRAGDVATRLPLGACTQQQRGAAPRSQRGSHRAASLLGLCEARDRAVERARAPDMRMLKARSRTPRALDRFRI